MKPTQQTAVTAKALFGDRFLAWRLHAGSVQVAVLNPSRRDLLDLQATLAHPAEQVEISSFTARDVNLQQDLCQTVKQLKLARPGSVLRSPGDCLAFRFPPIKIVLAAADADLAPVLHAKYGSIASIQVGAIEYPVSATANEPATTSNDSSAEHFEYMGALHVSAQWSHEGPSVARGQSKVCECVLTNNSDELIVLATAWPVESTVIDLQTSRVVGGYVGGRRLLRKKLKLTPGAPVRASVLIGTASYDASVGSTLPAGGWGLLLHFLDSEDTRVVASTLKFRVI